MDRNKSKKKNFIILGVILLGILLAISTLIIFMFNGDSQKKPKPSAPSTPKVTASSTLKLPINEEAYLTTMGDRLSALPLPVIGQIAVPELKVNLPIFEDSGDKQILYGAGTVGDNKTIGTGNTSLASHRVFFMAGAESYLFSPLTASKNDMKIYLTDKTYIYEYKIDNLFVVPDTDLSVLDPVEGKTTVTLIYCVNYTGPDRAIVRGTLESKTPFVEASAAVKAYFSADFNQIPVDQVGGLE